MVGDVEQLRKAGVLVAAQGRVDHVVGEDPRLLGLVPDPAHGTLGQRTRLGDAQADTSGGIDRHSKLILPWVEAAVGSLFFTSARSSLACISERTPSHRHTEPPVLWWSL
jgi:hypothetical protein